MIFVVQTKNQTGPRSTKQPQNISRYRRRREKHACMRQHIKQAQCDIWNR